MPVTPTMHSLAPGHLLDELMALNGSQRGFEVFYKYRALGYVDFTDGRNHLTALNTVYFTHGVKCVSSFLSLTSGESNCFASTTHSLTIRHYFDTRRYRRTTVCQFHQGTQNVSSLIFNLLWTSLSNLYWSNNGDAATHSPGHLHKLDVLSELLAARWDLGCLG